MFFNAANKGNNMWALYVLGVLAIFFGYMLGQIPLVLVASYMTKNNPEIGSEQMQKFLENPDFTILGVNSNLGLLILLCMFVFAFIALVLVMKYLHKRNFLSLVNFKEKLDWQKIAFGFKLWMLLGGLGELFSYFMSPETYTFTFQFYDFLFLLVISLTVLPIQTSLEELFIRGYLMQGMGLIFRNKWLPWIISSLMFGLIHGSNPEIGKYGLGLMMSYYIFAGLFLGLITIMDDSLELALGVHFATNFFGATILGYESSAIQTNSLFKTLDMNPQIMLLFMIVSAIIFYIVCAKKYKWPHIKTLFIPIEFNKIESSNLYSETQI